MSGTALSAAMMKAYNEGLGVDFALVCQGVTKHVHSQVFCVSYDIGCNILQSQFCLR